MFEYRGYKIEVTSSGWFSCACDDWKISKTTLSEAQSEIDRVLSAVPKKQISLVVAGILQKRDTYNYRDAKVYSVTVTGINRTSRELQTPDIPKGFELRNVMADTPENREFLGRYIEARRTVDSVIERTISVPGSGRIDLDQYEEALKGLEKSYQKSVNKGE